MHGRSPHPIATITPSVSPALLAAAFALFVFVVTTLRAAIEPGVPVDVFSDKRIIATLLGGFVYWLTLRAIAQRIHAPIGDVVLSALKIVVMGSVALLAVRAAMDLADSVRLDISIARNIRWLLLWLGYFASWVAGFVAHAYYLRLKASPMAMPSQDRGIDRAFPSAIDTYECADPLYSAGPMSTTGS